MSIQSSTVGWMSASESCLHTVIIDVCLWILSSYRYNRFLPLNPVFIPLEWMSASETCLHTVRLRPSLVFIPLEWMSASETCLYTVRMDVCLWNLSLYRQNGYLPLNPVFIPSDMMSASESCLHTVRMDVCLWNLSLYRQTWCLPLNPIFIPLEWMSNSWNQIFISLGGSLPVFTSGWISTAGKVFLRCLVWCVAPQRRFAFSSSESQSLCFC